MRHSEHVLRPAILQPPRAQRCENVEKTFGHNALEHCKTNEKAKSKVRKPFMVGLTSVPHPSFIRWLWAPPAELGAV